MAERHETLDPGPLNPDRLAIQTQIHPITNLEPSPNPQTIDNENPKLLSLDRRTG